MSYAGVANAVLASGNAPSQAFAAAYFTDVPWDHWAFRYIMKVSSGGGIDGMGDGTFRPDAKVTREQFVKMLLPTLGLDISPPGFAASQLTDVSADRWSAPYIGTALRGIYDAKLY